MPALVPMFRHSSFARCLPFIVAVPLAAGTFFAVPFPARLDLATLDGGNGFAINGIAEDDSLNHVSSAGDVNGDGLDDLIIGALSADPGGRSYAGQAYVIFGSTSTFPSSIELAQLDGSNGFILNGVNSGDVAGISVSGAGDINGDGLMDVLVGASGADPNGLTSSGRTYVVFGSTAPSPPEVELSSLNGVNGFTINGVAWGDISGTSVGGAGDVNGDGIDDLIIGAPNAPDGPMALGETYVVFGSSTAFPAEFELAALDGSNGFVLRGIDDGDASGGSVSGAGDLNGDGFADLLIGAPAANEAYAVFGGPSPFPAVISLSSLDGNNGFTLHGGYEDGNAGRSVSAAGDFNADGIDDIVVGCPLADPRGLTTSGEAYVVFGRSVPFPASVELIALDGTDGFKLPGIAPFDAAGLSVSGAADINGDDIADLVISADAADPQSRFNAGETYVIFGGPGSYPASIEVSSLDGSNGFTMEGVAEFDFSGYSVAGLGDLNADGADEVAVVANQADPNGLPNAGSTYVVFGRHTLSLSIDGNCPGEVVVRISNGPVNQEVGVIAAAGKNGWTKGGMKCNGIEFEISEPFRLPPTWIPTDGHGNGEGSMTLESSRCWLEAVSLSTCETSRAVRVP